MAAIEWFNVVEILHFNPNWGNIAQFGCVESCKEKVIDKKS